MSSTTPRQKRTTTTVLGGAGHALLHCVEALFLIYSAYHGIHATTTYRAASGLGNLAGILGIVAIEVTLAAIYIAWVNNRIVGPTQQVIAGITYAVGFIFACLGIIGDSQLQAGLTLTPWIRVYLTAVLPAAPALMAVGAFLIIMTAPEALRKMRAAEDEQDLLEDEHDINGQLRLAEAQADATLKRIQLDTKLALAAQLRQYVSSPDAQRAIVDTAQRDGPALLRAVGIYVNESGNHARPDTGNGASTENVLEMPIAQAQAIRPAPVAAAAASSANGHRPSANGNGSSHPNG